jgi:uncharacterized protein YodC (DUF2158 family)
VAEQRFNIGDIVQLKSGGPKMTVTQVFSDSTQCYNATWFAGAKREGGNFPHDALQPVSDDK